MHDLLCAAGRDWGFITTGVPGQQQIAPCVVAADSAQIRTGNGVWITLNYDFGDCPPPDIVCVPDFPLPADDPCIGRFDAEVLWLRQCHEAGATLACTCTAAIMLAQTGLLDGMEANHSLELRAITGQTLPPLAGRS